MYNVQLYIVVVHGRNCWNQSFWKMSMNYKMHMMCIKAKLNDYIIILNNHIISYVEQIKNLYMLNVQPHYNYIYDCFHCPSKIMSQFWEYIYTQTMTTVYSWKTNFYRIPKKSPRHSSIFSIVLVFKQSRQARKSKTTQCTNWGRSWHPKLNLTSWDIPWGR